MLQAAEFYKYYQANFFKFQQIINKEALDNIDYWLEKFDDDTKSNDRDQVSQIIKSHIRLTYLHCIDTLFELIFGLYPRDHIIQDQNLPLIISRNNDSFNKHRIQGFANNSEATINEITQDITFGNQNASLIQYIIYHQISSESLANQDFLINIKDSIKPILSLLSIFAADLTDKSEYNSLKHALRVVPFTGSFNLLDPKTNIPIAGIDFKDAQHFIIDSQEDIKITTKNFNTERDYKLTLIASKMIWNIIKLRDSYFSLNDNKGFTTCFVYFFDNDEFEDLEKSITHRQEIVFNIKKNMP